MATGIIGTLGVNASLTYTPGADAKVIISATATGTGTTSVNGTPVIALAATGTGTATIYVGANQQVVIANNAVMSCVVSSLEGN